MKNKINIVLIGLGLIFLGACKDDDGNGDPCTANFNQEAMFVNLADNLILPAYAELNEAVNDLSEKSTAFVNNPAVASLNDLRSSFFQTYLLWQRASPFEFGPAADVFLRASINNFPLNVEQLMTNVETEIYDFNLPEEYDKGLPALDYLLFGVGADEATVVDFYAANENYKNYLLAVVKDIKDRVNQTNDNWTNGYRATFVNNTGTAAGTALSQIVNQINQHYEFIKREKLGVPSGVLTLGFTNPETVEAYFSGFSVQLAMEALEASYGFYLGRSKSGVDGIGFDDYLVAVNAEKNGALLSDLINAQYIQATAAVAELDRNVALSDLVENETDLVVAAYNEVTKQLVNLKTDMPSVLCVSITYIDNPSDSD